MLYDQCHGFQSLPPFLPPLSSWVTSHSLRMHYYVKPTFSTTLTQWCGPTSPWSVSGLKGVWQLWRVGIWSGTGSTTEIHAHMRWQSPSLNHTSVVALSPGPSPPKERRGLGTRLSSVADEVCYWSQLTLESANSISHCS